MALNINGTTGISGVDASVSAPALTGTDSNSGISFPSADTIKFSTGGVERMSITNSGVSGITQGITMVDSWGLDSGQSLNSNDYISGWVRRTGTHGGNVGGAMSVSGTPNVFTFPSTGLYLMMLSIGWYSASVTHPYAGVKVYLDDDGDGSFSQVSSYYSSMQSGQYGRVVGNELFDVTSVSGSAFGLKFQVETAGAISAQGGQGRTSAIFIKYGDT